PRDDTMNSVVGLGNHWRAENRNARRGGDGRSKSLGWKKMSVRSLLVMHLGSRGILLEVGKRTERRSLGFAGAAARGGEKRESGGTQSGDGAGHGESQNGIF